MWTWSCRKSGKTIRDGLKKGLPYLIFEAFEKFHEAQEEKKINKFFS